MLPHEKVDLMKRAFEEVRKDVAKGSRKKPKDVKDSECDKNKVIEKADKLRKKPIYGAKRKGSYTNVGIDCHNKHKKYKLDDYGDNVLLIGGADGSDHGSGSLKKVDMISWCEQFFGKNLQDKGVSTSNSDNIVTIMQVNGKEESRVVHAALKKFGDNGYYEDKKEFISQAHKVFGDNVEYWPYEVNDLKMAHCLLGIVNYNREHGSNLLCNCSKRVGVKENETHKCQ